MSPCFWSSSSSATNPIGLSKLPSSGKSRSSHSRGASCASTMTRTDERAMWAICRQIYTIEQKESMRQIHTKPTYSQRFMFWVMTDVCELNENKLWQKRCKLSFDNELDWRTCPDNHTDRRACHVSNLKAEHTLNRKQSMIWDIRTNATFSQRFTCCAMISVCRLNEDKL